MLKKDDIVYFFSVEKGLKEILKTKRLEVICRKNILIVKDTAHVYFYIPRKEKMCVLPKLDPNRTRMEDDCIMDDSTLYSLFPYILTSKFMEKIQLYDSTIYSLYPHIIYDEGPTTKFAERGQSYKAPLSKQTEPSDSINRYTHIAYNDRLLIGLGKPSTLQQLVFLGATVDTRERCAWPPVFKFYSFFKDNQYIYYQCFGNTQLSIIEGLRPIDYQVDDYDQLALLMRQLMYPLRPMLEVKKTKRYTYIQVAFSKHLNTNSHDLSELKKRFLQVDYIKEKNGYRYIIGTDSSTIMLDDYIKDLFLAEIQKIIPGAKIIRND